MAMHFLMPMGGQESNQYLRRFRFIPRCQELLNCSYLIEHVIQIERRPGLGLIHWLRRWKVIIRTAHTSNLEHIRPSCSKMKTGMNLCS